MRVASRGTIGRLVERACRLLVLSVVERGGERSVVRLEFTSLFLCNEV